jgi:hypothetical protein
MLGPRNTSPTGTVPHGLLTVSTGNIQENFTVLWDVTPCSLRDIYYRFRETFLSHFRGRKIMAGLGVLIKQSPLQIS